MLISMLYGTAKYLTAPKESMYHLHKSLFYLGFCFYIIIFLTFFAILFLSLTICNYPYLFQWALVIYSQLYSIQCLFLLAFLSCKLYFVFKGSVFALSRRTIIICSTLYAITTLFGILAAIAYPNYQHMSLMDTISVFMACFMVIVMAILVNVMLIAKLVQVYKMADSDQYFIDVVTKTSLLALISTGSFLVLSTLAVMGPFHNSFHVGFVEKLCLIVDCFTNFWCTLLSFKHFDGWYLKLCCDSKCKKTWYCILGRDEPMMCRELTIQ